MRLSSRSIQQVRPHQEAQITARCHILQAASGLEFHFGQRLRLDPYSVVCVAWGNCPKSLKHELVGSFVSRPASCLNSVCRVWRQEFTEVKFLTSAAMDVKRRRENRRTLHGPIRAQPPDVAPEAKVGWPRAIGF